MSVAIAFSPLGITGFLVPFNASDFTPNTTGTFTMNASYITNWNVAGTSSGYFRLSKMPGRTIMGNLYLVEFNIRGQFSNGNNSGLNISLPNGLVAKSDTLGYCRLSGGVSNPNPIGSNGNLFLALGFGAIGVAPIPSFTFDTPGDYFITAQVMAWLG